MNRLTEIAKHRCNISEQRLRGDNSRGTFKAVGVVVLFVGVVKAFAVVVVML